MEGWVKTKNLLANTKGPTMSVRCLHIKQSVDSSSDIFSRFESKELATEE